MGTTRSRIVEPTAIKRIVADSNLTQRMAAEKGHVSEGTLRQWLREDEVSHADEKSIKLFAEGHGIENVEDLIDDNRVPTVIDRSLMEEYFRTGLKRRLCRVFADEESKYAFCEFDKFSQPIDYLWCDPEGESYINANYNRTNGEDKLRISFKHEAEWAPNVALFPSHQEAVVMPSAPSLLIFEVTVEEPRDKTLAIEVRLRDKRLRQWTYAKTPEGESGRFQLKQAESTIVTVPVDKSLPCWRFFPESKPSDEDEPDWAFKPEFEILTGVTLVLGRMPSADRKTVRKQPNGLRSGEGTILLDTLYLSLAQQEKGK